MTQLTERQQAIKSRLDEGKGAREIAEDLGITRNAVYQQIQRLRRHGVVPPDYTPTGVPTREQRPPGVETLARLLSTDTEDGTDTDAAIAGAMALVQELQRTRDELDVITRRLSAIVPR